MSNHSYRPNIDSLFIYLYSLYIYLGGIVSCNSKTMRPLVENLVWGRHSQGSLLPGFASPSIALIIIFQQNSIAHNYILTQNSIVRIYFSRTASRIYSLFQPNSNVRRPYTP